MNVIGITPFRCTEKEQLTNCVQFISWTMLFK